MLSRARPGTGFRRVRVVKPKVRNPGLESSSGAQDLTGHPTGGWLWPWITARLRSTPMLADPSGGYRLARRVISAFGIRICFGFRLSPFGLVA